MTALSALHGVGSVFYSKFLVNLPVPQATKDLPNQTIIVTGANTGLGFETCRHLLRLGVGRLIMAVRNRSKGATAKQTLLSSSGRDGSCVEIWLLDMNSYTSVQAFAQRAAQLPRLDAVLANAGILATEFTLSEGVETSLNVNVVSTMLLCLLLIPVMRESGLRMGNTCRFVIPNSALHYMAPLAELDPETDFFASLSQHRNVSMRGRYMLTKLLVLYAVREIAERCRGSKKGTFIINSPNPSYCKSNLGKEAGEAAENLGEKLIARSTEEGSRVLYHGIIAGVESDGQYLHNCHVQAPACHVTSQWGQKVQKRFFEELLAHLEKIQPGISSSI